MKLRFVFNAISTIFGVVGVILLKLHDLTSFHVFVSLFFLIVFLLMYIERNERKYKEVRTAKRRGKRFFMQRANVLTTAVLWFYITYSVLAKDVYFTNANLLATNLLSVTFTLIAVGSSFYRKRFKNAVQEKIMVVYVVLLCFPMNLLQNTSEVVVGLRLGIFFLIFNLELYVGKLLHYRTTYKQLVLCSYFALVVNEWYLVVAIPIVLTHFLEISKFARKRRNGIIPGSDSDEISSESSSSDVENGPATNENQNRNRNGNSVSKRTVDIIQAAARKQEALFSTSKKDSDSHSTASEEIKRLLSSQKRI